MTGYCKYCDSLVEEKDMVKLTKDHRFVWVGCYPCYKKKTEIEH